MIIKNTDGRDDEINHDNKYKQIHEINLSKKNIINFKNKKMYHLKNYKIYIF